MEGYHKELIIRFFIILIVTLCYPLFFVVLAPITIYITYLLLNIFYEVILIGNSIGIGYYAYNFIEACIAPAAYYLLFVLIMGIKGLKWKKGVNMFLLGSLLILGMNIIRIIVLILLNVELGKAYFDAIHMVFWNFLSGIYIAIVWIFLVKKYKIGEIPYWDDLSHFYNKSLLKRNKSKVKK